jgi:hypothetical protein
MYAYVDPSRTFYCDYYGTVVLKEYRSTGSTKKQGTLNSNCPDKNAIIYIPLILAAGIIFWTSICLFCCCLKRRKINGDTKWVCRRSTKRCACLARRPRSMEDAALSDQRKAMQIAANNNYSVGMMGAPPMMMAPPMIGVPVMGVSGGHF